MGFERHNRDELAGWLTRFSTGISKEVLNSPPLDCDGGRSTKKCMEDFKKKHAKQGRGKWNDRGRGGRGRGGRGGYRGGREDGQDKGTQHYIFDLVIKLTILGEKKYYCHYHGQAYHSWSRCRRNPANGGDYYPEDDVQPPAQQQTQSNPQQNPSGPPGAVRGAGRRR